MAFNDRTHTRDVGKFSATRHHQKPLLHSKVREDKAPPGFEGTVKGLKKHTEVDNPFALAWYMYNKGETSHK